MKQLLMGLLISLFFGGIASAENFHGELPKQTTLDFPKTIPIAITEIQAAGQALQPPGYRDALWIQIRLTKKNLSDIASYFAVGVPQKDFLAKLKRRLGARSEVWVDLQDLFPGWISKKVNSFALAGDTDNDFTLAREFFDEKPGAAVARPSEALTALLNQSYCPVPENIEPRFGDVLVAAGWHAGRFIVKDPVSGRGIVLSVYPGGSAPYRFWWMDEDFSLYPFEHKPERDVRRSRVDVWRRCKPNAASSGELNAKP